MKLKQYTPPRIAFEKFIPNEYVAACADGGTIYKFSCDAPEGTLYYAPSYPVSGAEPTSDRDYRYLGGVHPCDTTHEVEDKNSFYWGFIDYNNNQRKDSGESVIVYVERGTDWFGSSYIDDWHATKNLVMSSWEKNHS